MRYFAIGITFEGEEKGESILYSELISVYTVKLSSLIELSKLIEGVYDYKNVAINSIYECKDIVEFQVLFELPDSEITKIMALNGIGGMSLN